MSATAEVIKMKDELMVKEFNIQEITEKNLNLMKKQILEIPEMPEDSKQYNSVKDMHIQAKKILPRIEERRKELKAPVLEKSRLIDDTAKKAVSMVQPLIELSSSRRSAWEDVKAKEKAEAERIEKERTDKIENLFSDLGRYVAEGQAYNVGSEHIQNCINELESFEISAVDFQEKTEQAESIQKNGIETLNTALKNRLKFEAEQAAQEAEKKRLAEEKAKFEAEQRAAAEAAKKKADEEAEKQRKINEKLEADRLALEKEKAEIQAKKDAEEKAKRLEAEKLECHEKAIIENIKFDEIRILEEAKAEKARQEKLKADKARAKIITQDKKHLLIIADSIDGHITDMGLPELKTDEANQLVVRLFESLKADIKKFHDECEGLV